MLRRAAVLATVLSLAACTEHVVINDVPAEDGGAGSHPPRDAAYPGGGGDALCQFTYASVKYTPRAAEVVFLLDRSSSMQLPFNGTTRAAAAQEALLSTISQYQSKVKFGFEQFPPGSNDRGSGDCQRNTCCAGSVTVEPKTLNAYNSISGQLQCGTSQGSPCPAPVDDSASYAALVQVRDFFNSLKASSSTANDDRYVVLVTSSEPSCSDLSDSDACNTAISAANDLGGMGVCVVVVSVGYQPPDPSSSCLVTISKTGSSLLPPANTQLYTPSSSYFLSNDLDAFAGVVARAGCTLDSNDVLPPQAQLQVSMGSATWIPQVDSTDQPGWSFANPAHTSITLSGTYCTQYVESQYNQIQTAYTTCPCGGPNACQQWQPQP